MSETHRHLVGAVAFLRRAFEDGPGDALPEVMLLADRVDELNRDHGLRFRADLVKMLGKVEPTFAPIMAAGRIPEGGSTHVGASPLSGAGSGTRVGRSLLSPVATGPEAAAATGATAGDPSARASQSAASEKKDGDGAAELAGALPLPRIRDRVREVMERTGNPDEAAEAAREVAAPGEAEGVVASGILWATVGGFQAIGYGDAADALSHYLQGEGKDVDFAAEDVRKYKILQFAEEENRDQITGRLFAQAGGPSGSQGAFSRITGLEDGESVDLEPMFVERNITQAEVDRFSAAGKYFIGKTRLVSEAKLRAERHGDTIVITGTVEYVWSDPYDFVVKTPEGEKPAGGFFSEQAVTAERTGYALRYNRGSGWTQTVRITIPIVDGQLGTPGAEWEDIDEAVDWKTWKPTKPLD